MVKAKPTKAPAPGKPDKSYISNPFRVMQNSYRAVITLNLRTFMGFALISILSLPLGLLIFVSLLQGFRLEQGLVWIVPLLALFVMWVIVLLASFTKYSLETAKGKPVSFGQSLSIGYRKAGGYGGLIILVALLILGGLLLLIIPGLIFMYWFLFAPYIYINEDVTVMGALSRSRQLVRGQLGEIVGLLGAGTALSLLGVIPVIGIVYSVFFNAIFGVAWSYRYLSAERLAAKGLMKPATSPVNYWALVIALLASIILSSLTESQAWLN